MLVREILKMYEDKNTYEKPGFIQAFPIVGTATY